MGAQLPSKQKIAEFDSPYPLQFQVACAYACHAEWIYRWLRSLWIRSCLTGNEALRVACKL